MSLRLYLDDCAYDRRLRDSLRVAPGNHLVVTPMDAGTLGHEDEIHFAYARQNDLILVTKNPVDFLELHAAEPDHPGLLLIYQDNRPSDMTVDDIVQAIANLEAADLPFYGHYYVLNHWQF